MGLLTFIPNIIQLYFHNIVAITIMWNCYGFVSLKYKKKNKTTVLLFHNRRKLLQTSFRYIKKKILYKIHKILSHRAKNPYMGKEY